MPDENEYYRLVLNFVLQYIWPPGRPDIKARVLTTFALILITKLTAVSVPFLFKFLVDRLSTKSTYVETLQMSAVSLALCYGAARIFQHVAQEFRYALFMNICQASVNEMNARMFRALLNQSTAFHLAQRTGSLVAEVERGLKGISGFLTVFLFHLLPTLLEMILVCSIMTYNTSGDLYSALLLSSTVLAALFCYTAFTYKVTEFRKKLRVDINTIDNGVSQKLLEGLTHHESVKLFGTRDFELKNYSAHLQKSYELSCKNSWSFAFLNLGQAFIFSVALTLIHLLCIPHVQSGLMTVGDLVLMNALMLQLSFPLNFLGTIYREITQSAIDMKKLFALLGKCGNPSEDASSTKGEDVENTCKYEFRGGKIEFRDVCFTYPSPIEAQSEKITTTVSMNGTICRSKPADSKLKYREILQNVSFTVPSGQMVAFIGPSGCGKSTILRLIAQLYKPTGGEILLDNQESSALVPESIRSHLGYLTQDPILFHDSVYYNIAYGRKSEEGDPSVPVLEKPPHDEQALVQKSAVEAQLIETVSNLPQGFDTVVGDRGTRISGGERQRIALARIFMKDPEILLADEPTSALDASTEGAIMESLRRKCKRADSSASSPRTLVVVAHRLSSVKDADCIFVMENGRIVEKGTHEELLSRKGSLYDRMWSKQRKGTQH